MARLVSPSDLKQQLPPPPFSACARAAAEKTLTGQDKRLAILVGPCSIHDPVSAREYAKRLKTLSDEVEDSIFLVMRLFLEKPRTKSGWKGLLYDPYLDNSNDIGAGLRMARELLIEISELGVPSATELLDPLASFYFDDLISWGMIGARTSASQPHRQMASRLSFPVGFKNDLLGFLEPAIFGALSARSPQTQIGLDGNGHASALVSNGNPFAHIVLRGSDKGANCDPATVEYALKMLEEHHLPPRLLIDCSHGNSGKNLERQKEVFLSAFEQATSHPSRGIAGLMLESNLLGGHQPLTEDPAFLSYGVSITDPCLSWEETEALLRWAGERLSLAPTSMSFVQN